MDGDSPGERYGQFPSFLPNWGLDVAWGKVVREVDVELDVLEVGWVVHHVQYKTASHEQGSKRNVLGTYTITNNIQTRMSCSTPAIDSTQLPKGWDHVGDVWVFMKV